jgi:hypothetical protein
MTDGHDNYFAALGALRLRALITGERWSDPEDTFDLVLAASMAGSRCRIGTERTFREPGQRCVESPSATEVVSASVRKDPQRIRDLRSASHTRYISTYKYAIRTYSGARLRRYGHHGVLLLMTSPNALPVPPLSYAITLGFKPQFGGLGINVSANGTPSLPAALPTGAGPQVLCSNDSNVWWWLAFGGSSVSASPGWLPVPAGTQVVYSIPDDGSAAGFYSVVTRGGAATGTINFGIGQ